MGRIGNDGPLLIAIPGGGDSDAIVGPTGIGRGNPAVSGPWSTEALFVWGIWVLMLLGNLALVLRFTSPYPFGDELHLMFQTITPQWLWQQHAEHRVPLAKLVWLGVLELTNYNFRVGNAISVLSVGAVASAMIWAARRLRGWTSFTDAFFPLAMLSFGQGQNFLWWWVFNHILPPLIACCLLLVIVFRGEQPRLRDTILVAAILALLFLSGPGGLPYVLTFALWLSYRAVLIWRSPPEPHRRRDSLIVLGLAVFSLTLVGLYFVGFDVISGTAAGQRVSETGLRDALKTNFNILCVSLGPTVAPYRRLVGLILLGLLLMSAVLIMVTWLRQPRERLRASGLILFFGATGALLLVVGRARVWLGYDYIWSVVYINMTLTALCSVYLAWVLYRRPAIGKLVQMVLFILVCIFFLPNLERALAHGRYWIKASQAFGRDMRAGVPPFILAERHARILDSSQPDVRTIEQLVMPPCGPQRS